MRRFGKSFAHPLVVLIALPNDLPDTRIGVAAGRSIGSAVRRNRAKRLLRAATSGLLETILSGWDILLIARHTLPDQKSGQVQEALVELLKKAGLLEQENHVS